MPTHDVGMAHERASGIQKCGCQHGIGGGRKPASQVGENLLRGLGGGHSGTSCEQVGTWATIALLLDSAYGREAVDGAPPSRSRRTSE